MSLLQDISINVQQVAEAISIAVGVEVEIVDNKLTIIGGTGVYKEMIGKKKKPESWMGIIFMQGCYAAV